MKPLSWRVDFPGPFITEVYTDTEPVAREARKRGLRAGESLTLSTGWNFLLEEHRTAAKNLIRRLKPYALVLAFPLWAMEFADESQQPHGR